MQIETGRSPWIEEGEPTIKVPEGALESGAIKRHALNREMKNFLIERGVNEKNIEEAMDNAWEKRTDKEAMDFPNMDNQELKKLSQTLAMRYIENLPEIPAEALKEITEEESAAEERVA